MSRVYTSRSVLFPLIVFFLALSVVNTASGDAHMTRHHVPYFLSADHETLHSVVRITWFSCRSKPNFTVQAYDDSGVFRGILDIPWSDGPLGCGEIVEFTSDDLEDGNADKGISGVGSGDGDWQLFIEGDDPYFTVSTYLSTDDGFLAPMHDTVPFYEQRDGYHVTTFNFADAEHESRLRIINPNDVTVYASIYGQWDTLVGGYDYGATIPLAPHEVITVTDQELETYNPVWQRDHPQAGRIPGEGVLGEPVDLGPGEPTEPWIPSGRWRLYIQGRLDESPYPIRPLIIMHLMEDTETGLVANLSSRPDTSTTIVRDAQPVAENTTAAFDIDFVFAEGMPQSVRDSFARAAYRWESVIVGDLPAHYLSVPTGGCNGSQGYTGEIDDLLIFVSMGYLGGRGGPSGRANVCATAIRGDAGALLPVAGWVRINEDARDNWSTVTALIDAIVTHEIGHTLGFTSSILGASGYLRYYPTRHFAGPSARQAFIEQGGSSYAGAAVPMADSSHWHGDVLTGEIMAPSIAKSSVISRITVQALADLGYEVDVSAAETYYKNVF